MRSLRPIRRSILLRAGIVALFAFTSSACVYKIDVQQGNYLDRETLDQVEVGMEQKQVRFLMGNPVAEDPFRDDRWTYTYYRRNGRTGESTQRQVVVFFDEEMRVARVEHDLPEGAPATPDAELTPDAKQPLDTEDVDFDPSPEELERAGTPPL